MPVPPPPSTRPNIRVLRTALSSTRTLCPTRPDPPRTMHVCAWSSSRHRHQSISDAQPTSGTTGIAKYTRNALSAVHRRCSPSADVPRMGPNPSADVPSVALLRPENRLMMRRPSPPNETYTRSPVLLTSNVTIVPPPRPPAPDV